MRGGDSKQREDDECEDYERRDEDAQTQETENADAVTINDCVLLLADGLQS